jgi:HAD superfamily hydrolase (TIGR01484 family)
MWALSEKRIGLVLVTGRPAGWVDALARIWPLEGAIAENGGVSFLRRMGRDGARSFAKLYARPFHRLAADRARLTEAADAVRQVVPGARLSEDSRYTEVDMAFDYDEEVHLGESAADKIEAELVKQGITAVRSSVHINFWIGPFDKLSSCRRLLRELEGKKSALPVGATMDLSPYVYVGDSLNDAPMFEAFPHSVGVANVRKVLKRLSTPPKYVTKAEEGRGFEEVVAALIASR